jgi:hypothetical protein
MARYAQYKHLKKCRPGADPKDGYEATLTRIDAGRPTLIGESGEPGRTRTCNPLIKSQLLYH